MHAGEFLKKYIYPISTLSGSIIGVGIFSLPYIAMKAGIWVMLIYFFALTFAVSLLHIVFAEISLNTPDFKRFPGFVGYHLGKVAEIIADFAIIIGTFTVLLAYLVIGGEFLSNILMPYFGGSVLIYTLLYFALALIVISLGIKTVSKFEFISLLLLLLSLLFIFIKGFFNIKFQNILIQPNIFSWRNLFLPYGAIMFSLWGTSLIPEVEEMCQGNKLAVKKIVAISTVIPAIIYIFFVFIILGMTGFQTSEMALPGLKNMLSEEVFKIALFAGVLTTFAAFVTQGLTLKKVLVFDLGIKNWQAIIISCFVPLIFFLLGFNSFIPVISFTGSILLGVDAVLILLMYKKIGGKKYIIYPLSVIFIAGIIYQIIYFIK